ncbi:MAG: DUF2752 domain-containing protein [Elusimicrobiota bacterium]
MKIRHPLPFSVVAGAAWLLCAAQAACGVGEGLVLCPVRLLTGHRCPGCGMGHAVAAAMRGDWLGSIHHHPLGIPLLAVWTAWLAAEAVKAVRSGEFARRVL